ncbi:MAG: aminomethyl-transferring glycine dehydrogenase subunit GcvPA, partial [Lentisphaerae bacterium]
MPYIANTEDQRREMLEAIGFSSMSELWEAAGIKTPPPELKLPEGMSEYEVRRYLTSIAEQNAHDLVCFLGLGFYDHFIPAVVDDVIRRTEFLTAYTPYQPEASQGTLQTIYEFQSMICRLTGMEAANASLYEGGTALFEAMMMAVRSVRNRRKAVVAGSISPIYREMLRCYCRNLNVELVITPAPPAGDTHTDLDSLAEAVDDSTSAVILPYPNTFGTVEDFREIIDLAHARGALCIASTYPMALSLIEAPAELGFDIVCGEAQCFGLPLSFGGPYLGYIACRKKYLRQLPGRIVGRTTEQDGEKEAFVLTLQAREQHIRRERATSNICSNEGLCAIAATVYLSVIGKHGFRRLGELCHSKAVYLRELLAQIDGVSCPRQEGFFNEFV